MMIEGYMVMFTEIYIYFMFISIIEVKGYIFYRVTFNFYIRKENSLQAITRVGREHKMKNIT